jgi:23S rRNA (cytosine1962-C5)-methyltransferase
MSVTSGQYELIDFGNGRKLERLGGVMVDRPCPAASNTRHAHAILWRHALLCYEAGPTGQPHWISRGGHADMTPAWQFRQTSRFELVLSLAPLPSGQVGIFPEQAANWAWIHEQCASSARPLRVLNFFAYTGASTIAAAAGGAEVTHVDAAKGMVERASHNAAQSGLADAPIRWIVDDAVKFATRELRRGNRYDAVILDPPTYGHGKKGVAWQIHRDLPELLRLVLNLTDNRPSFLLLTCHTTGIDADGLAEYLLEARVAKTARQIERGEMQLRARDGRTLAAGVFARTSAK